MTSNNQRLLGLLTAIIAVGSGALLGHVYHTHKNVTVRWSDFGLKPNSVLSVSIVPVVPISKSSMRPHVWSIAKYPELTNGSFTLPNCPSDVVFQVVVFTMFSGYNKIIMVPTSAPHNVDMKDYVGKWPNPRI